MKKLPPRKTCRETSSRSRGSTPVTGVGRSTTGMWHDWQLRVPG